MSHSRDLVHWETIGYVAADPDWARKYLGPLEGGRGFWAPDISYHDGWFTVCATLRMNDDADCIQTQFVARSRKPEGPYEKPVIHKVLGIDPSISMMRTGAPICFLTAEHASWRSLRTGKNVFQNRS